jgi:hypothetical protein
VDMAGGCEEFIAVGGGIRTGAGTSVELKKNARQTRPLKILVGRAGPLLNKQTVFG